MSLQAIYDIFEPVCTTLSLPIYTELAPREVAGDYVILMVENENYQNTKDGITATTFEGSVMVVSHSLARANTHSNAIKAAVQDCNIDFTARATFKSADIRGIVVDLEFEYHD